MGFLLIALLTGIGFAIGAVSKAAQKGRDTVIDTKAPNVQQWSQYLRPAAQQHGIDPGVAEAWLAVESGGNICAVGNKFKRGPDGSPLEIGLFQLYNPDDFDHLRAKASDLRAYCVKPADGQPDPQRLARNPTPQEIAHHISLGIGLILRCMQTATHYLSAAGITWGVNNPDFWRVVKLVHALPIIVGGSLPLHIPSGFVSASKKLGHTPATWAEFRTAYESIQPRARFNPALKEQDGYWRALENAERTGDHFEGLSVA